eukprot:m.912517 g.912517  ORF g.912517 m.912517 type:complete len:61 (+) comp60115_c0_seq2:4203-4385(+)
MRLHMLTALSFKLFLFLIDGLFLSDSLANCFVFGVARTRFAVRYDFSRSYFVAFLACKSL